MWFWILLSICLIHFCQKIYKNFVEQFEREIILKEQKIQSIRQALVYKSKLVLKHRMEDVHFAIYCISKSDMKFNKRFVDLRERFTMWLEHYELFEEKDIKNLPIYLDDLFCDVYQRGNIIYKNFKQLFQENPEIVEIVKREPFYFDYDR